MAENSKIEWTHHTFNPWIGCTKVSAACDHCYAEAWDRRFGGERWGPHAPRTRTKTWGSPVKWNRQAQAEGRRYRVFCASLADVFDNHRSIAPEWRSDLWRLIRGTPNLDWLLLTKRPQNITKFLPEDWGGGYPNVWLGATVENQKVADQHIQHLLAAPARVRFLSCEPLLGPIDLTRTVWRHPVHGDVRLNALTGDWMVGFASGRLVVGFWRPHGEDTRRRIHWVIAGGESGPLHRAVDPDWFRALRDQCAEHDVAFLFKQWEGRNQIVVKAKGRALDDVVHDGYPAETLLERTKI